MQKKTFNFVISLSLSFALPGIVKYFIEKCGETPKLKKYKKYGSIGAQSVRVCMESIIAIAHSPFFTCEYYSKLSPLWQEIAHKVKPTYKVVLRTAVDNLATPAGIHWRPIILPNFYKHLVNSETEVYDDISIMPWHSYPNVNIMQKELRTTDSLPCVACHAATQTDVSLAVVVPTAEEVQTDSEPTKELNLTKFLPRNNHKSEVRSYEILKAFNKLMESELRQYASADENNNVRKRRQTASLTTNQWFPVVLLERSKSIESLLTLNQTQDLAAKRQKRNSMSRYGH